MGRAFGAAVLHLTAAALTRQIRRVLIGVPELRVRPGALDQIRESHYRTGIPLPSVGVARMAAPTVPVRLMPLPKTIKHVRPLSRRGQLRHERPEHLGRAGTNGAR
jgi:hypothetical protein